MQGGAGFILLQPKPTERRKTQTRLCVLRPRVPSGGGATGSGEMDGWMDELSDWRHFTLQRGASCWTGSVSLQMLHSKSLIVQAFWLRPQSQQYDYQRQIHPSKLKKKNQNWSIMSAIKATFITFNRIWWHDWRVKTRLEMTRVVAICCF